jgi:hypothetical protein
MVFFLGKIFGAMLTPIRTMFYWVARVIPGIKKIGQISLPMRYALLSVLALLIILTIGIVKFAWDENQGEWANYYKIWPIVLCLFIAIPVVVYFAVRLLLQGDVSRFPDIDFAWKQGVEALKQNGIEIGDTPIFLVIGNPDHSMSARLHQSAQISMNVQQVPEGPAALHWYGNQDGIFLYLTEASCLSRLASMSKHVKVDSFEGKPAVPAGDAAMKTMLADGPSSAAMRTMMSGDAPRGGSGGEQHIPMVPAGGAAMETMQADPNLSFSAVAPSLPAAAQSVKRKVALNSTDVNEQGARLEYVCHLLKKSRYPVCPINGLLALIPFHLVEPAKDELQSAAQRDLAILNDHLGMRCSLTVMVNEMESEPGFQELVRRVGMENAKRQRFGKGCNLWSPAGINRLKAVSKHACAAFEDWTYMLFKEHDGLRKPGNTKLFSLLCKIRGQFADSLAQVLAHGFGFDEERNADAIEHHFLFGGCYFAASGDTEDRQAFVTSVFLKVMDQEAELSWTPKTIEEDDRYKLASNLVAVLGLFGLISLGAMIWADQAYPNYDWFAQWFGIDR